MTARGRSIGFLSNARSYTSSLLWLHLIDRFITLEADAVFAQVIDWHWSFHCLIVNIRTGWVRRTHPSPLIPPLSPSRDQSDVSLSREITVFQHGLSEYLSLHCTFVFSRLAQWKPFVYLVNFSQTLQRYLRVYFLLHQNNAKTWHEILKHPFIWQKGKETGKRDHRARGEK